MPNSFIEHYTYNGRVLRFENNQGVYPINRDQSLLMATNALNEALAYAGQIRKDLKNMRALEVCCGGGPAALVLKDAGVGYVEASDLDPKALEACQHNAFLNDLRLDKLSTRDMLGQSLGPRCCFDLIVCNPPCRPTELLPDGIDQDYRLAIDGGAGGVFYVNRLLKMARDNLVLGGRLIFILTSTMEYVRVVEQLEDLFRGNWRLAYATPISQPFVLTSDPVARRAMELTVEKRAFVWDGGDGRIWRLIWIVVAINLLAPSSPQSTGLWFFPYGGDASS